MADSKNIDLIAKYLSGNISDPERADLLKWVESDLENQQFFDEMVQLWGVTGDYEEEFFETDIPKAWNKLEQRIDQRTIGVAGGGSAKVLPLTLRSIGLRAAAVTLLLIAASYGVYSLWNGASLTQPFTLAVVNTQSDETRDIELPDGTKIWLNENTRLSYREDFVNRTVELEGEAFFDVAHQEDNPFVILSGEVETTVLGTAFNLRAYPGEDRVEVTVQRGKVQLAKKKDDQNEQATVTPVILEAGNRGVFDLAEQKVVKFEEQVINADAWKTGILNFDGLSMDEVITVLQRYYNVTFEVKNEAILNCSVTNLYFEKESLDTVLSGLAYVMHLNFKQPSDSVIVLNGKGCLKKIETE